MNTGLNLEKELQDHSAEDYLGSAISVLDFPCIASIPSGKRKEYLPTGELQNIGEEKMDCASRAPLNILETKLNYLLRNKLLFPENDQWLKNKDYIDNNEIKLSDAYIAIKSDTTREGNSLKAPIDAIYRYGVIPKKLLPQLSTFEAHHDPERITQELDRLGQDFLSRFPIRYERVFDDIIEQILEKDMQITGGHAWPKPINGIYPSTDLPPNHAFINFDKPRYLAFDNYLDTDGDFIKVLAPNYNLLGYGYRLRIKSQKIPKLKTTWQIWLGFLKSQWYG